MNPQFKAYLFFAIFGNLHCTAVTQQHMIKLYHPLISHLLYSAHTFKMFNLERSFGKKSFKNLSFAKISLTLKAPIPEKRGWHSAAF